MLKNRKNIGIIGCGIIADTHIEVIQQCLPQSRISVCDPEPGKAECLKKKYGLHKAYYSMDEMLEKEKPFSAHILSPPQLHVEHTIQCLESGCNVLVEKPLAFSITDVDKLYEVARKYGKVLCVDHSLICQPSVEKMLKMLEDNDEKILYINCFYGNDPSTSITDKLPPTHWKKKMAGGSLIDIIIHPVTLAVELTGKPGTIIETVQKDNGDIKEACFNWKSEGTMCSLTVSNQAQPFKRSTEIITDKNTYIIDHSTETLVVLSSGFGPAAAKKLYKNISHGMQLIFGTVATVSNVLLGRIKQNPGARGVIKGYYEHINENKRLPVSEKNAKNSTIALEKIIEQLITYEQRKSDDIIQETNLIDEIEKKPTGVTLVTGAAGFLGSHICLQMSKRKRHVIAQVRRGINADKLFSPYVNKIYEDFTFNNINYDVLLKGVKQVVHCAHASSAKTWDQVKKINVDETIELYKNAKKAGCEKFIYISSVAVYGVHHKKKITVNEDSPITFGKSPYDFYIHSKALAEKLLVEEAKKGGPELMILRPGLLYSQDGTKLARRGIPLKKSRLLIMFGMGKNYAPFTRVDVMAETICNILELDKFPNGIFNLVGNINESKKSFVYKRMKKVGVECKFLTMPSFIFKWCAFCLEKAHSILNIKKAPKITKYIIDSDTRNIIYDSSKAEKAFGWDANKAVDY